jgi:hypothetical protein
VGTSGRSAAPPATGPVSTLRPPTGVNNIWIEFDVRRWFLAGKAIENEPSALIHVGTYHGWSVYVRNGDRSTVYVPSRPGRLAQYKAR